MENDEFGQTVNGDDPDFDENDDDSDEDDEDKIEFKRLTELGKSTQSSSLRKRSKDRYKTTLRALKVFLKKHGPQFLKNMNSDADWDDFIIRKDHMFP